METVAAEEVDVSMAEVVAEDVEEEMNEVEEDTSNEVVEGADAHMKTDLTYPRYFEDSEWASLSKNTRKRITEDTVRTKFL